MAEEAQAKVQTSVKAFVDDVDRNHLRKMEKAMHECAARCCSDNVAPMADVMGCVERCSSETQQAQRLVQGELQRFQQSLDRCVAQCQDQVKDAIPADAKEADVIKFRGQFESCAVKCVDTNVGRLPNIKQKVKEKLDMRLYN